MPELKNKTPGTKPAKGKPRNACTFCQQNKHTLCTDSRIEMANGVPNEMTKIRVGWRCKCHQNKHV